MEPKLIKLTQRVVKLTFGYLSKPQQKVMAQVIVALFQVRSFTLRDIASLMYGDVNVKHKLKKLKNFLDGLELDYQFWKAYVKTIFCLPYFQLGKRKYITLLIDATTLRDDFWILGVSISYRGRAIPIYQKIWKGVNESYDYWGRVEEVMKRLKDILPTKYKYEIIADRGFQGNKLLEICKKIKWDYVIRINRMYRMKTKDGGEYIQLSLFPDGFYKGVVLGKGNPISDINVVVKSTSVDGVEKARWYLATNLGNCEQVIEDYSGRMWIEESYKDLKGILKWETYTRKIPHKGRLEKLIVLSSLSYALQLCIGSSIDIPGSEEDKTSVVKRFQHIIVSAWRKAEGLYLKIVLLFRVRVYRLSNVLC